MSEPKKIVFISCGQFYESERALGKKVVELVDNLTPFKGYFADDQSDLKGVTESILSKLHDSVGFIAIMHHRGTVSIPERKFERASVWIEQEIAIAAFMGQIINRPLRTVGYYQQGIQLEGVRQFILLNAKPFNASDDVLSDLEAVLPTWRTPLYEGLTPHQREAVRRKVNVGRIHAYHPLLTVWVTNRSDSTIFIKSASLWHAKRRLNYGVPTENRKAVEVRPHTENSGIAFTTDEDATLKLKGWGVVEGLQFASFRDDVTIEVGIEYEIAGEEHECREPHAVRIHGSRQIESI